MISAYSLADKTAIVTGGTGILGRRFCHALAEFGAQVVVVDLDVDQTDILARELTQAHGVAALGIGCDVSVPGDVQRMVQTVVERLGGVHVLLNNAASKSDDLAAFFSPFEDYSLAEWRKIMSVNIDGMFLVAQAVGRQMVLQGLGGSIVQTASLYGVMAPDPRIYRGSYYLGREINTPAVYAASKAGVIGLTRYLSTYWADARIRVNTISPGGVESGQNETFKQNYAARVPMGRMGFADEMASVVVFLASDASSYMTGQNLVIDGGLGVW